MIAWFICPYKRKIPSAIYGPRARYCAMDDFTAQIFANGKWSESEVLGGFAIVKVKADQTVIDTIDATPGYVRIPVALLNDPLSSLSNAKKTQIRDKILEMGYTLGQIQAALGNDLGLITLRQLLEFLTQSRKQATYDSVNDVILFNGQTLACKSANQLDSEVN